MYSCLQVDVCCWESIKRSRGQDTRSAACGACCCCCTRLARTSCARAITRYTPVSAWLHADLMPFRSHLLTFALCSLLAQLGYRSMEHCRDYDQQQQQQQQRRSPGSTLNSSIEQQPGAERVVADRCFERLTFLCLEVLARTYRHDKSSRLYARNTSSYK